MNPKDLPQASPILNDVAHADLDYSKIPYQKPQPFGMIPDLVVPGLLQMVADPMGGDPREWIPLSDTVSFRPVHFNVSQGFYAHVMRVTREVIGTLSYFPNLTSSTRWPFSSAWSGSPR